MNGVVDKYGDLKLDGLRRHTNVLYDKLHDILLTTHTMEHPYYDIAVGSYNFETLETF